MIGRQIRTSVPTLESNLQPEWPDLHQVRKVGSKNKTSYQKYFNKNNNVRTLPDIPPAASVAVKLNNERGWIRSGTLLKKCESPRSYLMEYSEKHNMLTPSEEHFFLTDSGRAERRILEILRSKN